MVYVAAVLLHIFLFGIKRFEDILVLKNNKGTEDNRVRKLDYSIQLNKTMYERLLSGGDITLFSPHDVPGLYEAYFGDATEFQRIIREVRTCYKH